MAAQRYDWKHNAPTGLKANRGRSKSSAAQHAIEPRRTSGREPELRTLLVSDLVAFTSIIETLGDRQGLQFIRKHNRLLRRCLRRESGTEIAHTGDGMIMSFRTAENALRCAALLQRVLAAYNACGPRHPMYIRVAAHAGRPYAEEDRLFGSSVNVAVRLCSVASSQQILLSNSVVGLVNDREFPLRERGKVVLRGMREPFQVFELDWRAAIPASCDRDVAALVAPMSRTAASSESPERFASACAERFDSDHSRDVPSLSDRAS